MSVATDPGHLEALRKAIAAGDSIDFMCNENPVCPHCGAVYDLSKHDFGHLGEEGEHEVDCGACERRFLVHTHVRRTYNTYYQGKTS